ncbi:hypothetical protein [Sporosarcina sp. FSL K6-1508]|uniref:hypothetical protein n=1 Tax=Sporosarcina sp. FSL K6-1508 TaxID=2921553 RepID=UPI0030FAECBC
MIFIFEALFIHGFLLFTWIFQTYCDLRCYLPATANGEALDEIIELPVKVVNCIQEEVVVPYEVSVLTEEHNSFFNTLSDSLNLSITEEVEVFIEDKEKLTMSDWKKEPEPVAVTTILAASANAKINDCRIGEQLWIVEVIGEEQGFIHVSDGSGRAWINSNGFGAFSRKDILSVLVERKTDIQVELLSADMLQEHSTDFSMVDELDCIGTQHYDVSVGA